MQFSILDVLTVSLLGIIAVVFLVRLGFKMYKGKAVSMCSGCHKNSNCSSKNFARKSSGTIIQKA